MASYIFFLLFLVSFLTFATTQAYLISNPTYLYQSCSDHNIADHITFQSNLKTLLSSLSYNATNSNGFYNNTVTRKNSSDSVFGLFMCRGDIPSQFCQQCVQNATSKLSSGCPLSNQAVIWYDECTVRYSNTLFFSTMSSEPRLMVINISSISNKERFMNVMLQAMNETADVAASVDKKFATREANISGHQRVYCLAQCTMDLSLSDCRRCLSGVIGELPLCCQGKQGGKVLYPSCNVRYELYPFYNFNNITSIPAWIPASKFGYEDSRFSEDPIYLNHSCSIYLNHSYSMYLKTLFSSMSSHATNGKTTFKGSVENIVNGFFMCQGGLPSRLCEKCILDAIHQISSKCNSFQEAIIWYNHCMLRYSNRYFFSKVEKSPNFQMLNATGAYNTLPELEFFTFTLANMLANLAKETQDRDERYVIKSLKLNDLQTLYALSQCTEDLSSDDCRSCLEDIIGNIPWSLLGSVGGRVLYPSCNLRFELFQFFWVHSSHNGKEKIKAHLKIALLVIIPTTVSVILFLSGYYLIKSKGRKSVKTILIENFGNESVTLEHLQFSLVVIKEATNNFSSENRIGKGGFGEVYKGILFDGRQIAVKKLSASSKQGANEFKNEVLLIARLQHRNLVTFIGFCLEDQNKILIYEYVPNKSLDYFLFDSQQANLLSWSKRYDIIGGIARGILYLHEDSRLKVIHRDLKPSNILLDENMIPKISDFGLARIIEIHEDQGTTNKIADGYMSPEYAMFGLFSEKSDVYSFGVMILEIITGKKNTNSYGSDGHGLLSNVWRQWKDQTIYTLDPTIKETYSEPEVIRCAQIGLLCLQQNLDARPTMMEVVSYLSNDLIELPNPDKPSFFLYGRMDSNGGIPFSINEMSSSEFLPRT